jgi:uncharacterized lipoprotein
MLLVLAACTSMDEMKKMQGSGEKRTYAVSFERAWNILPYAISESGGKVKDKNFQQGFMIADYGVSLTGLGERVAVFCQRKGSSEVEIEVVSKETLNFSASRTAQIFTSLDRQLRP